MKIRSLLILCMGLLAAAAFAAGQASAGELAYVAGTYYGKTVLGKVVKGKAQAGGEATAVKADLKQKAQRLSGLLTVGDTDKDKVFLEITDGKVEGNHLWFQGDELLWKARFSGEFAGDQIKGRIIFTSQEPTKKLFGRSKVKNYTPVQLAGPLEMRRSSE